LPGLRTTGPFLSTSHGVGERRVGYDSTLLDAALQHGVVKVGVRQIGPDERALEEPRPPETRAREPGVVEKNLIEYRVVEAGAAANHALPGRRRQPSRGEVGLRDVRAGEV